MKSFKQFTAKNLLPIGYYSIGDRRNHDEIEKLVSNCNNLVISDSSIRETFEYIIEATEHHDTFFRNTQRIRSLAEHDKNSNSIGHYIRLSNHPDLDPDKYDESEINAIKRYTSDSSVINSHVVKMMTGAPASWSQTISDQYDKLISAANKTRAPENMTLYSGVRSAHPYIHGTVRHPFLSTSFETSIPLRFAGGYGGATEQIDKMKKFPHMLRYYDGRSVRHEVHVVHPTHVSDILESPNAGEEKTKQIATQHYGYHPSKGTIDFIPIPTVLAVHVPKGTPMINTTRSGPFGYAIQHNKEGHATVHPMEREIILPPGGHSVVDHTKPKLWTETGHMLVHVNYSHPDM